MPKPWLTRAAVVVGVIVATLVGSSGVALAADFTVTLSGRGKVTFIDDGDMFKVCDTKRDGYGVTAELYFLPWLGSVQRLVFSVADGGDAGCDKAGYNVGNDGTYALLLCWNGPNATCHWSNEFNE